MKNPKRYDFNEAKKFLEYCFKNFLDPEFRINLDIKAYTESSVQDEGCMITYIPDNESSFKMELCVFISPKHYGVMPVMRFNNNYFYISTDQYKYVCSLINIMLNLDDTEIGYNIYKDAINE